MGTSLQPPSCGVPSSLKEGRWGRPRDGATQGGPARPEGPCDERGLVGRGHPGGCQQR